MADTKKTGAFIGRLPERFSQRKLPKGPLIIMALLIGTVGAYAIIRSFAASDPNLLFNGTQISQYNIGSTNQFVPGAISVVPDPLGSNQQVFKMTVNNTDVAPATPTDNPRAQLIGPDDINNGDDVWVQTKILLPNDFPSNIPGWMSLFSIYGPPFSGSGPWEVSVEGNSIQWDRNGTYHYDVPWSMPIVKNQWITVLVHQKFASSGFVEMWINGQPVTFFDKSASGYYNPSNVSPVTRLNMQTMDSSNNGGANAAKILQYRQKNMFSTVTTYVSPLIIGKTQAAVQAADAANGGTTTGGGTTTPPPPPPDTTKPTTSLTSPTSGSTVSGQVSLTATASDNTAVSKVEFYADGTLLSTDTSAPYTATWNATNAVAGTHTLSVKAYDAAGNVGTASTTVNIAAAPTAGQLALNSGGFESGNLNNWNISGVGDVVPTVVSDITRNGSKSAKVILTGNQGRSELVLGGNGSASTAGTATFHEGDDYYYAFSIYINQMVYGQPGGHNVIFQLKGDDQQSPALALQLWNSPGAASDGSPGGKGLWYSGDALGSDRFMSTMSEHQWHDIVVHFKVSNKGVGSDQIYLDGKLLRSDTNVSTLPTDTDSAYIKNGLYRNGDTVVGTSDIRIDDAKLGTSYAAVAESSAATPVTPPPDTTLPTVSLTAPVNNVTVSGTVTATAAASDNTGVTKVEFYVDGTLKMTDTASPYNYSFDSKTLTNGSHTIMAKAYDAANNSKSATATVTVNNADTTAPNAPANLAATAATTTSVNLTWNVATDTGANQTGVTKYNVLRNGVVIAQPTTTSYADTGLIANTSYSYVIQAVDGSNNTSVNSNTATVKTLAPPAPAPDTTPPTTPTNLQATAASTNQVNLTWNASTDSASGVAGYNVYRNGTKLNSSLVTTTSYGDTTAADNTSYSYQVEAVDGSGNKSAKTGSVTVTTPTSERGDITGPNGAPDGKIGIQDISYVIRNYNTSNPTADVSGPNGVPDGTVNIYDLSYIIRNYGK